MPPYLLEDICYVHDFLLMNWSIKIDSLPIHVYYQELWLSNYKLHFYDICNYFFAPLYILIFKKLTPRMSYQAIVDLQQLGDWYTLDYFTYIWVFGILDMPHLLPNDVMDMNLVK